MSIRTCFAGENPMRIPECVIKIKIAADDITKLRKVDVFRVLDSCNVYERKAVSEYITSNRPDLAVEVADSLSDIVAEQTGASANA